MDNRDKIKQLEKKRDELREICRRIEKTLDGVPPLKTILKGIIDVAGHIFRSQKDEIHIENLEKEIKLYKQYIKKYGN